MSKDDIKKHNSFFIMGLIFGILFSVTGVYAVTQYASNTVYYINKNSGLSSNNVQGAIDELATIHKPGNNDCPSGYVCTKNLDVYTINLDASFGISDSTDLNAGTVKIYLMKDDGIYLDRGYTKKMTTTENPITIPVVTGYTFKGYYNDSNEMLINENGYITSSFTNDKFSKTSTINAKWEANNYVITLSTNKPSPLNDGYYTNGTNTVYMKYGTGVYLDDAYTNKMTTSDNAVTNPTATGYNFLGYYDGDTQMIDENGKITSNFTNSKYASAKTLEAKWTRNFTCTRGDTPNYMGKSWYVISNSNNVCEMALNATVGNSSGNTYNAASGTGTGSVYSYIKSYSKDGVTLEKEYNAGLISSIDTSSGNVTEKPPGIYWISSGRIYSSTAYYKYTIPSTTYTITQGYAYTNKATTSSDNLTYYSGYTTDSYDTSSLVSAGGTASLSNTSSKFTYYNKPTSSSASSSSGGWSIYETRFTYNIDASNGINTSCDTNNCHWGIALYKKSYNNSGKSIVSDTGAGRSYIWRFYSCGGSHRTNATRIAIEMKSATTTDSFYYSDYNSGNTKNNRSTNAKLILAFAGRATRTDSLTGSASKKGKNTATFDMNSYSDCKTTFKRWNSPTAGTIAVKYRPHIKVKMNT